jgi:O-antigen ligase
MLASILVWILITRDRYARFGFLPIAIGLGIAAFVQSSLLVVAAARHTDMTPTDWIADAGSAWLVVPNDIAWMACILPLVAIMARRRTDAALWVMLAIFLGLCALMRSRTAAIVAFTVAALFVALRLPRWRPRAWRWLLGIYGAVVAAFAMFGIASMHARLQLWSAAWSVFLDNPWTGVGIHNFALAYRNFLPPQSELIDPRITPWPHNLVLEVAAECGLIGSIAMLFLVGCLVRRGLILGRTTLAPMHCAAFSGLLGMALLALVEASLLRQWFWLLGATISTLLVIDVPPVLGKNNEEQ